MPNPTPFQKRLATTAGREYQKFRFLRENQDPLMSRIKEYWKQLGSKFESVSVPWSAVFASTHGSYQSHSAVVVEVGVDNAGNYLRTIGGNEADSVGLKEVRLDAQGRVKNPDGLYISVIETLL